MTEHGELRPDLGQLGKAEKAKNVDLAIKKLGFLVGTYDVLEEHDLSKRAKETIEKDYADLVSALETIENEKSLIGDEEEQKRIGLDRLFREAKELDVALANFLKTF